MGQGFDVLGALARVIPEASPGPIDASRIRKVLIVKLSSIGDVVHALPVAAALKRSTVPRRLTWAVEDWTAPLVLGHHAVDRVVAFPSMGRQRSVRTFPAAFRAAVRELRRERYDAVLDLQGLARSALVAWLSRSPLRIARRGQREGAHLISRAVDIPAGAHAVDEYLAVAREIGGDTTHVRFDLPVRPEARTAIRARLAEASLEPNRRLVVVCPSASTPWKSWPVERWAAVLDAVSGSVDVIIAGTAGQRTRHEAIVRASRRACVDLTGRTSLAELVALLELAALHVAHDSGSVHIAAALGTPVVAVYGPTSPVRLGPYGQGGAVVYHGGLCGRGCPAYCLRRRRCLLAAAPGEVISMVERALCAVPSRGSA